MSDLKSNLTQQGPEKAPQLTLVDAMRLARHFSRKEDGVMTIFAMMMLMMMLLVGGIGVDIMRNEMERAKLQGVIDRAVLAAADIDQTLDPEEVVNDYFNKAGMADYLSSVTVNEGLNYRTVLATANSPTPTQFMRLMGVDELNAPARSKAEERISNVEISMVLDISGSMRYNSKMMNLRNAAKTFVDEVLREETEDLISVSLIPYTAQVNAGDDIYNELNTVHRHPYSHCIDFEQVDFNSTTISLSKPYEQMQHFEKSGNWYGWNQKIENPGCPTRSYEEIVPLSQNANALKSNINNFTDRANTAIHLGMKWGVTLLDPTFRPVTQALSVNGKIDAQFSGRPSNYDDPETLKTVILMTDGQNVDTWRIRPWYYNSSSEYSHWNYWPIDTYLWNAGVPSYQYDNWRYIKYTSSQADSMLDSICDAAKSQGIVIWSIGFEVSDFSAGIMQNCASSPAHFFRVEGVEISEAFSSIASQINQLRLTQ